MKNRTSHFYPLLALYQKKLFGTATIDDVNILASHINALNKETNRFAVALKQHGDHLSSFISIADKRMTQMKGIKTNA